MAMAEGTEVCKIVGAWDAVVLGAEIEEDDSPR
jgi:hypothetical protein